jgi:hypothetical protein
MANELETHTRAHADSKWTKCDLRVNLVRIATAGTDPTCPSCRGAFLSGGVVHHPPAPTPAERLAAAAERVADQLEQIAGQLATISISLAQK